MPLLKDLQTQFATQMHDFETLAAKADLSQEDHERLDLLLTGAKATKAGIEQAREQITLAEWGQQTTGVLPLASGDAVKANRVHVEGFSPADDIEGLIDEDTWGKISAPAYKSAFREYLRAGGLQGMKSASIKTLQEGSDVAGGFLVPAEILARVIAKEPAPTSVQGRVMQMNTGRDALVIPKVNYTTDDIYTTGMRITWTGEIPSSSTVQRVTDPIFGQVRIPVHTAMMSIPVSQDLIDDANFDLMGWLSGKFGETRDLLLEDKILNGTGIGQPAGILLNPGGTNQPALVQSGSSGNATADTLIQLGFALPPQYDDSAAFIMEKTVTARSVAQLKDGNGRYLWGMGVDDSGLRVGVKGRNLLGYDVVLNQFMPTQAASSNSIIFGDLKGYYLVNRVGLSIQVLRELYAETNQVLILGRVRFGGQVAEDWRLKVYQNA